MGKEILVLAEMTKRGADFAVNRASFSSARELLSAGFCEVETDSLDWATLLNGQCDISARQELNPLDLPLVESRVKQRVLQK
jgi:hypothetical protein